MSNICVVSLLLSLSLCLCLKEETTTGNRERGKRKRRDRLARIKAVHNVLRLSDGEISLQASEDLSKIEVSFLRSRRVDMFSNETNSTLWPCLHAFNRSSLMSWNPMCILCRIAALIILFISIICLTLDIRYLIWFQKKERQNCLVLSLFLASLLVLTICVPGVLLQLFTCHRHCNQIYCTLEGFVSYLAGSLCMLIYMVLSINRYLLLCQYHPRCLHRYSAMICWFLSIAWTLPPVFHVWISYVPEGHGFHCSINWKDQSRLSRLYVLFSFLSIYFVPLLVLFSVNLRVHRILRHMHTLQNSFHAYGSLGESTNRTSNHRRKHYFEQISYHRSSNTICYIRKAADRKRFRIEYRFIQAIIFLVSTYIIAWTPYSIIAVLQLFHIEFVFQHAYLITLSAFMAKLSVILAPLVYLSIMHSQLFKKILV